MYMVLEREVFQVKKRRKEMKRIAWTVSGCRRFVASICAFMMMISSGNLSAFAEEDGWIYSKPVSNPVEENGLDEMPATEEKNPETPEDPADPGKPEESGEPVDSAVPEVANEPEAGEGPEEPDPEQVYHSGTLTAETAGSTVQIEYSEEAKIPEGVSLSMETVTGSDLFSALMASEKLVQHEADAVWSQKVTEKVSQFYALRITDADGNSIEPKAGVTLTYTNPDSPQDVEYFLTGDHARIMKPENGRLSIPGYAMELFGYASVEKVQIGTVTQEYVARDYTVTASYGPEAGFPADTELKVREIKPGTPEYALYSGMTEEALNEDWSEITLERYFDITFVSGENELEPQADVDVQITFRDAIELTEEHEVQAVHIENNEAKVIESETDSVKTAKYHDEAIDTVTFSADSFSVYGVVQKKKIIQKVLAADGQTYEIEVTYGPEAGIPEDAEVKVEEIPEGSDLWEAYRQLTATALGADNVRLPGLYDISIIADGQTIEPAIPVNVSIKLANAESGEELHVVHFPEDLPEELVAAAAEQGEDAAPAAETQIETEQITAVVTGDTVTFETDGFSVYAFAYTVDFHYGVNGEQFDYSITGGGVIGLRELMKALNILDGDEARILEFVEEIEEVTFTDESLVKVVPVTEDTTAAALKEKWELVCSYSAELTKEQIAEMDAKELFAPDWAFVSLQAFNTDEKLTIRLKDGEVLIIDVTDAQLVKTIITSGGETYKITVTYDQHAGVPEGATLEVSEILPESGEDTDAASEYSEYEDRLRDTLGWENGSANYLRLFDIRIVDENGEKVEIEAPVDVSIELMDRDSTMDEPQVVHFVEDAEIGDVLTDVTVEGDTVFFEAESFSAYAVVKGPDPVPIGWTKVQSVAELLSYQGGLYIGHPNGYYLTNGITVMDNGRTGITKTTPSAVNPPSTAKKYWFEQVEGTSNQVYVYTYTDDGTTTQYVRNNGNSSLELTGSEGKTAFTVKSKGSGKFTLSNGSWYWNMQNGNNGTCFSAYEKENDSNNNLYFWYFADEPTDDAYQLDGKTQGLMFWDEGVTGKAMLADELDGTALKCEPLTVMTKKENKNDVLFVSNDSNITLWTFHHVPGTLRYLLSAETEEGTKYLKAENGKITLTDSEENATRLEVIPGTDANKGKMCLKAGDRMITYTGNTETGFVLSKSGGGREWLYPVNASELTSDYFMTHSAKKVSISDASITNGTTVILYTRYWNEEEKKYEFYAVDYDGKLVRCYEAGDSIEWVGGILNSMLWNFVEYYDDQTPNGYYDMFNDYSEKFLAPQMNGQIVSADPIGLNMTGRESGKYYSDILAWDKVHYCYAGFKVEDDQIKTCIKQEALDFYFALVENLNVNDTLTPVATVDNDNYGITMKIVDFDGKIHGTDCDTSKKQHEVIGYSALNQWNATQGLLSTNLVGDYPIATRTGTSLSALFGSAQKVNHLFLQGTYNATGYYAFDSMNNYAYLNGQDFVVYKELGTHDSTSKNTLKHGQFFPFNNLTAGKFASLNRRYTHQMNGSEVGDSNPRKNERLYLISNPDYFFGIELEAKFMQTPSGKDAWGHDIIFEFTGDDDFWLYVDGELVIDLGGIHGALAGKVNFCTGDVVVNGTPSTLRELFTENYKTRNGGSEEGLAEFLNQYFEGDSTIFRDYSDHTMKIFYMERGAGASNINMRFNLAAVQKNHVKLSKELDGAETAETVEAEFPYQILYKMPDDDTEYYLMNEDPIANHSVDYVFKEGTDTPVKYLNSLTIDEITYNHVFMLAPGDMADISFPEDAVSYSIVECGLNNDIYTKVTVNDVKINGRPVTGTNRSDYQIDFVPIKDRSRVRYNNTVTDALRTLEISKKLFDESGENQIHYDEDKTEFAFRLYLGTEYTAVPSVAKVREYCVKTAGGEYCRWDSGLQTFVSLGKTEYSELTDDEIIAATFFTSTYGQISNIPVDFIIEVRGLLAGTRYRVEERPWEIPDGYKFKEYVNSDASATVVKRLRLRNNRLYQVPGSEGIISKDTKTRVDVCNLKGFVLRVNKKWTDETFMEERDITYFAVFAENESGLQLVDGSVRALPRNQKSLYWYYDKLPIPGISQDDYLIREVTLSTAAENLTVNDDGVVSGYTDAEVTPVEEGGSLTLSGRQKGENNDATFTYTVHYQKGTTLDGSNIRVDEVTNRRPGIIIRKVIWGEKAEALGGATFTIRTGGDSPVTIGTFTSEADGENKGRVTEAFLSEGVDYILTETAAPQGYAGLKAELTFRENQDHKIDVTIPDEYKEYYTLEQSDGINPAVLTIKNRPYQLQVIKTDRDNGEKLSGVHFELHRKKTVGEYTEYDPKPMTGYEDLETGTGDVLGVIPKLDNTLPAGSYRLDETASLSNYLDIPASVYFTVSGMGEISLDDVATQYPSGAVLTSELNQDTGMMEYTVTITNVQVKKIRIQKIGDDKPKGLAGAKFSFKSSATVYGFSDYESLASRNDGYLPSGNTKDKTLFILPVLPDGQSYILNETETPAHYLGLSGSIQLYVKSSGENDGFSFTTESEEDVGKVKLVIDKGIYVLKITNTRLGTIRLRKTVKLDDQTIPEGRTSMDGKFTFTLTGKTGTETEGVLRTVVITWENGVMESATIQEGTDGKPKALTADSEGYLSVQDLPLGEYTLTETDTGRPGYISTTTLSVDGTETEGKSAEIVLRADSDRTAKVNATNAYTTGLPLPTTGGSGTMIYVVTGTFLILLAGALLLIRKRKNEQ